MVVVFVVVVVVVDVVVVMVVVFVVVVGCGGGGDRNCFGSCGGVVMAGDFVVAMTMLRTNKILYDVLK